MKPIKGLKNPSYSFIRKFAYLEVSYRLSSQFRSSRDLTLIDSNKTAVALIHNYVPLSSIGVQEFFLTLFLNRSNRLLAIQRISIGSKTQTIVEIPLILKIAIDTGAQSIIIAHNHPSGKELPSNEDYILTEKIEESSKLLGIALLDHIVFTDDIKTSYSIKNDSLI